MAAYAAMICLKHTINGLLDSSRISLVSSTREILEFAYNETTSLQQILERLNDSSSTKRLDELEGQIRDDVHKLEDILEFHELNSFEDEEVIQEIISFAETMKKMETDYIEEVSSPVTEDDAAIVSSHIDFGVEMVGHFTLFNNIRKRLLSRMRPIDSYICSFFGEIGTGRTFFANTIFEDVRQFYDCSAWMTLGRTTHEDFKEVVIGIVEQVEVAAGESLLWEEDENMISAYLYGTLEHRKYLIVLDDVRDLQLMEYLWNSFPDQSNGSLVLFTTDQEEVAELAECVETFTYDGLEESMWNLLRLKFFDREHVSPELEEAGRKIIDNCRRLLISFFKTVAFLSKTDKTVEEWSKIAANKDNLIFMVEDEISEINEIKREMQSHMDDKEITSIVGLISHIFDPIINGLKMVIHPERFFSRTQIICLVGMPGIGKSTLAKRIIQDESILCHFDYCVWITLGQKYQAKEILVDILAQIYPSTDKMRMKEDDKLVRDLCLQLSSKRCLIVVDDLWSKEPLHHLKNLFPDIKGATLVTTTLADVARFGTNDINLEMELLDKEESWYLLCQKVFGGEECPTQLEKAGRKIAEECEGLPLLILTVADQLLQVPRSREFWNNVASGKEKSVFMNAHLQISKALLPRYQSLPQHLKICFLYIGVFRPKYKIPTSDFINLLIAERLLETNRHQKIEEYAVECLFELVQRSLVMVQRKAFPVSEFKTCRLHPVFWHLANSEAMKNKFFHAMSSYDDCSVEKMRSQRRLCIRNSILLGFKDVQNSMTSITKAHSLLCVSPLQQYPVPIDFDMRLMRVMNAITIRLYEFPAEVVRLVHLTYLSLTCNGKLPTSLSNLWRLQYLIVKRYMNIKSSENLWLLPVEIWDMKELKHLQIMGGHLPSPRHGAGLLKLSTLLNVSSQSCREEVLKWMPNLKRLGIQIELAPDDQGNSFYYLNNINCLQRLESLKCTVVNPQIRPGVVPPIFRIPSNLKRLSLSGFGYPWKYMNRIIGGMQNLEVLKLKHYAFQGPKWEMDPTTRFGKLESLTVEDTNLVKWKLKTPISWCLEHLCFKHCYKIQELPIAANISGVRNMEIVECSPFTVTWVEQIGPMLPDCKVKVHLLGDTHQE